MLNLSPNVRAALIFVGVVIASLAAADPFGLPTGVQVLLGALAAGFNGIGLIPPAWTAANDANTRAVKRNATPPFPDDQGGTTYMDSGSELPITDSKHPRSTSFILARLVAAVAAIGLVLSVLTFTPTASAYQYGCGANLSGPCPSGSSTTDAQPRDSTYLTTFWASYDLVYTVNRQGTSHTVWADNNNAAHLGPCGGLYPACARGMTPTTTYTHQRLGPVGTATWDWRGYVYIYDWYQRRVCSIFGELYGSDTAYSIVDSPDYVNCANY